MALEPGSHLGRYRIERTLGAGAMGEVYVAQDPHIERQVALKTVRLLGVGSGSMSQDDLKARLMREARTAGRLVHPHVVTLFDAGESEGLFYLAFELITGADLSERMRQEPPLTLGEVLRIARQAADGLEAAHRQGIIHRDIKPSNLLLDQEGGLKISDFGIAKMLGQQTTELTQTGSVVGSPHYLSPEQVRGEELDGRSDLFSLGVVLYELLSRRRPFDGETITTLVYQILSRDPVPLASVRPGLPERLERAVGRLLAKDREARFADARALSEELTALERELPAEVLAAPATGLGMEGQKTRRLESSSAGAAPVVPPAERLAPEPAGPAVQAPPPAQRRSRAPLMMLGAILVLGLVGAVAVGAGAWWWLVRSPERPAVADLAADRGLELPAMRPEGSRAPAVEPEPEPEAWREELAPGSRRERPEGQADESTEPAEGAPGVAPQATLPDAERTPTGPQPAPPPAEPAPTRPAPSPPVAEPPPSTAPEPEPELEPAGRQVVAERTLSSGLQLSFRVSPDDTFVSFMPAGGQRFISIGQASDYPGSGRRSRSYSLPGPGEYYLRFVRQGMSERILLVNASGSQTTTVELQMAAVAAEALGTGELERVRVAQGVAFSVQPAEARSGSVLVDGERRGSIRDFGGGLAGGWLELPSGDHRVTLEAPGFRTHALLVEVRPGYPERRERVEVRLLRQ